MNQRQAKRTPVTLKIKFKSDTLDQFIERYAVDISHGGIFIRTKDPLPVGTSLRFEFQLKDATPLIGGEGTVVWTRDPQSAGGGSAPGMGVRFDRLPPQSQDTLEAILAHKPPPAGPPNGAEGFSEVPTRVAPSPLAAELAQGEGPTPLPMPFSSADDVDEEAFEASTKVASFDDLMASARKSSMDLRGGAPTDAGWDDAASPWSDDVHTSTGADLPVPSSTRASGRVQIPAHPEDIDVDQSPRARRSSQDLVGRGSRPSLRGSNPDLRRSSPDLRGSNPSLDQIAAKITSSPRLALVATESDDDATIDAAPTTPLSAVPAPPTAAQPATAAPAAAPAAPAEEREGRGPVIAVAAALIVVAGLGGYYLMTRDPGTTAVADTTDPTPVTPEPAPPKPAAVTADAPPAVARGTATVTVESKPAGAMAALLGPGGKIVVSKPTPATFDELVGGATYKIRVTQDGYVAAELDVVAGGKEPAVAELEPMPKFLRVTSSPAGATVYVNGRRYGETPTKVQITGRLARADAYQISVRKRGYKRASERVASNIAMREEDGAFVHEVSLALERVRRRPPPNNDGKDEPSGGGQQATADNENGDTASEGTDTDTAGDSSGTDTTGDTTEGGDTVEEPVPDWMKSG